MTVLNNQHIPCGVRLRYVDKEKALEWLALSPPKGDDTTKQEPISLQKCKKQLNYARILEKKEEKRVCLKKIKRNSSHISKKTKRNLLSRQPNGVAERKNKTATFW